MHYSSIHKLAKLRLHCNFLQYAIRLARTGEKKQMARPEHKASPSLAVAMAIWAIACLAITSGCQAYTVEENLHFIEKVITKLNDTEECQLPSYLEVDELQTAFGELEQQLGPQKFASSLSDDMRLVRTTLLDQWDSFQRRMTSEVVIRAAKRRAFMCKVERYQEAKGGSSICARFKDSSNRVSDRIFEKNPIVRYLKHLDTHEVIERPEGDEVASSQESQQSGAGGAASGVPEPEAEAEVKTIGQQAGEPESTPKKADSSETERAEIRHTDGSQEGSGAPEDETKSEADAELDENMDYDPLVEVSQPKSTDEGEEQPKEQPESEQDESPKEEEQAQPQDLQPSAAPTQETDGKLAPQPEAEVAETRMEAGVKDVEKKSVPVIDDSGLSWMEPEDDDEDLARVVRLPKKDWEFDQVFGYFKWPDEDEGQEETDPVRLDHQLRHQWNDFMDDPDAFDEFMKRSIQNPKVNGASTRRKKQEFFAALDKEQRNGASFGWKFEAVPDFGPAAPNGNGLKVGPGQKDRWVKLLNNQVCRMGYNTDAIKRKAKGGVKSVKGWMKSLKGDREELNFEN